MTTLYSQYSLFPDTEVGTGDNAKADSRSGTFTDNMKLPIHRWFRYSAGFSSEWVRREIGKHKTASNLNVLDPFSGSGTTLLAAQSCDVNALGFESHPFIYRVARAKLNWNVDRKKLEETYLRLLRSARNSVKSSDRLRVPLLGKCFTPEAFDRLDALRSVYFDEYDDGAATNELLWLGITAILRECSTAGTAQWQYVLPNKKKANVKEPFRAFASKMEQIISDIAFADGNGWTSKSSIRLNDARKPAAVKSGGVDLVITSPPYPNNYDYADATRLEMTYWGEVNGWGDLHAAVRQYLIRSCSQHSARDKLVLDDLLEDRVLRPIRVELAVACRELERVRLTKGGRKTYHTMAAAYFVDLGEVFEVLRSLCKRGSKLCFVVGDSAPYGVYLAVDKWLGELALAAGFVSYSFEKLRDRNVKWKNRKHNVPLHEGRLWIEG